MYIFASALYYFILIEASSSYDKKRPYPSPDPGRASEQTPHVYTGRIGDRLFRLYPLHKSCNSRTCGF